MKVITRKMREKFNDDMLFYKNFHSQMGDWNIISKHNNNSCKMYKKKHNDSDNEVRLAVKYVKNLYAKEVAYQFWDVDEKVKMTWDRSMESMEVLERCSQSSAILHIKLKKMMGVTPRECIIHSEIKKIGKDEWMVSNNSVEYPVAKEKGIIRVDCNVVMIIKQKKIVDSIDMIRENVVSEIVYKADVNLGGWIPKVLVDHRCNQEWPLILENICDSAKERYIN
jgi:hypothetical protein